MKTREFRAERKYTLTLRLCVKTCKQVGSPISGWGMRTLIKNTTCFGRGDERMGHQNEKGHSFECPSFW